MDEYNKPALYLAIALLLILGWALGWAEDKLDAKPDCEEYWTSMAIYLRSEGLAEPPEYIAECAEPIPIN